jgi:hypothetical protein
MADVAEFSLPGTGYDVLKKILHAYALCGTDEITLDEVSQRAGMNRTTVSSNNGFLAGIGVIEGGKKKKLTGKGHQLAIAISHDDHESSASRWREIIAASPQLKAVLDMIRVQGGIPKEALPGKIGAHFGIAGGKNSTGLNAIVSLLEEAGAIVVDADQFIVAHQAGGTSATLLGANGSAPATSEVPKAFSSVKGAQSGESAGRGASINPLVPIHINIELHLPATAEQNVYDAIFKSIRQNLMETGDALPQ